MRVESNASSADCWRFKFSACPHIMLDGTPLKNVVMADDGKGIVEIIVLEKDGKPKIDDFGMICTKFLMGAVEIVGPRLGDQVH